MSDSPENSEYYLRLMYMYIDLGTETVLKLFYHYKPEADITQFLSLPDSRETLHNLKKKKVVNKKQYNLVTAYCPDAKQFDIVLLITLLTNVFPSNVLQRPQNGWNSKPKDSDLSIGADLLRLRKVRNNVLVHRPKAQMEKFQFEYYWSNISESLIRIIRHIQPEYEEILKCKIEKYKLQKLDAYKGSKNYSTLRAWEEIDEIQTQVEELLGTLKEFDTFFKRNPERFKRYVKLMIDGGRLVLKSVLYKELNQRQQDIGPFLQENEKSLKSNITNTNFTDSLYLNVSSGIKCVNPDDWDVALLAEVLLYGFDDLKPEDKEDIKAIQNVLSCYAETALLSVDSDRFTGSLIELTNRLTSVANSLDKDTKQQLKDLIMVCSKSDENIVLPEDYLNLLHSKGSHIKSLFDVHQETISKLKAHLNQMENDGISLKSEHKLEIKIQTNSRNQNTALEAEKTVLTAFRESICKAVDTCGVPIVRYEVDTMLESLTSHTDVTKVDVQKRCILLIITCSSTSSIQHVIGVFESELFQNLSYNLSMIMTNELQETVAIQTNFTLESLNGVLECRDDAHEDREIVMQVPYSTPDELKSILSPFESRELTNSVNRISGQLSYHFNETVTLAVTHEMKGMSDSDISDSSPKSEDFQNDEQCLKETKSQSSFNELTVDAKEKLMEIPLESVTAAIQSTSSARSEEKISADDTDIDLQQSLDRWRSKWNTHREALKGGDHGSNQMYCQLITFVVDICPKPLRKLFLSNAMADKRTQFNDLENYIQARKEDVNNLRQHFRINAAQYSQIYPSFYAVDIQTWDVSLLIALLLELFSDNLQREEKECIYMIQKIWDELKLIGNSSFLSPHMFRSYLNDLENAVCRLSQSVGVDADQSNIKHATPEYEIRVQDLITVPMYEKLNQEMVQQAAEIQHLRNETAQSSTILSKAAVKRRKRSGKPEKRMKIIDSRVERMKEILARAILQPNECEVSHKEEIDQIILNLTEHNRVVVTGQNNTVIYKCALAAVKQMTMENCLEINNPYEWQLISQDDADLVLFKAPFGRLAYDSQKADAMLQQFDSILMESDDGVQNIIIVTNQSVFDEVVGRHEHEMLSGLFTVIVDSKEKNVEHAHASEDTVHNNVQVFSQIYKKRFKLKTVDNQMKEAAEEKFINHNMVTIVGPTDSGTTLAFHLLSLYDLSNAEENFLILMDPSEVKYVNVFLRPVIIIKLFPGSPFDKVEAYKWLREFDRLYDAIIDNKIAVITMIETGVFNTWRKNISTHPVLQHVVEIPSNKKKNMKHGFTPLTPPGSVSPYMRGDMLSPSSNRRISLWQGVIPSSPPIATLRPFTSDRITSHRQGNTPLTSPESVISSLLGSISSSTQDTEISHWQDYPGLQRLNAQALYENYCNSRNMLPKFVSQSQQLHGVHATETVPDMDSEFGEHLEIEPIWEKPEFEDIVEINPTSKRPEIDNEMEITQILKLDEDPLELSQSFLRKEDLQAQGGVQSFGDGNSNQSESLTDR